MAIFPGGPVLASTKVSLLWIILEVRMNEVVVTTRTKTIQSSGQFVSIIKTAPNFYRTDTLPIVQPVSKLCGEKCVILLNRWNYMINLLTIK